MRTKRVSYMRASAVTAGAALMLAAGCSPAAPPTPTARALATQAAPVAAAVAQASPVTISGVQVNPSDTTITLRNASNQAFDLSGFRLRVGNTQVALPQALRVEPGETLTIHTARGTADRDDVFLGDEAAALASALQPGATLALVDPQGNAITQFPLSVSALPTSVATAVAQVSPVAITGVQVNPNDTTITLRNTTNQAIDLSGFSIRVGTTTVSLPAGLQTQPGGTVTIHTARGTGDQDDVFLGDAATELVRALQPGARVELVDNRGQVQAQFPLSVSAIATPAAGMTPLAISDVQLNPMDTTITLRNTGSQVIDLSGFKLQVGNVSVALPQAARLSPGETLTIHTARGTSDGDDLFLGDEAVTLLQALQPGARIAIVGDNGQAMAEFNIPRG